MDKVDQYQQYIIEALEEYKSQFRQISDNIQNYILADEKNHHYQFLWIGWKRKTHIFSVSIHIDIIDGKIWIQKDDTEIGIANLLVDRNVPKSDIVLAYYSPEHRRLTEYAVE